MGLRTKPAIDGAKRLRRHRDRRKKGLRVVNIEMSKSDIAMLVRSGVLNDSGTSDDWAITAAIYDFFDKLKDELGWPT